MRISSKEINTRITLCVLAVIMWGAGRACGQGVERVPQPAKAEELFAMANATRAHEGRVLLEWDPALAEAAMKHCMRMAAEGPIAHRYNGELDLTERAGRAGAHFSLIEENIAVGSFPAKIHRDWMESTGHRENLLNPQINRMGVAVVAAQGVLFAVEDFSRGVAVLSPAEVESTVCALLRDKGVSLKRDTTEARAACRLDRGLPNGPGTQDPQFVMRWQDPDLSRLPSSLLEHLASGRYRQAAVGSCPARNAEGAFTLYRVAVLLY
jgi:hypothetical protein